MTLEWNRLPKSELNTNEIKMCQAKVLSKQMLIYHFFLCADLESCPEQVFCKKKKWTYG